MRVLIVGGGGREHVLAWKLKQSPRVSEVFVAPGNAGTAYIAKNLNVKSNDVNGLLNVARQYKIDLTVVGPEAPLEAGIVDFFSRAGLRIFGPTRAAARLETSKVFAKKLMRQFRIPTAPWAAFFTADEARQHIARQDSYPVVVKADGLAAGKGVFISQTREEAESAIEWIMVQNKFGESGRRVVIEGCLTGKEVSVLAFTDGVTVIPMVPACDYKRAFDGNRGPNTGGMGAYSPPSFVDDRTLDFIRKNVLEAAVRGLALDGTKYKGVLYAGIMLTDDGPRVLEFNVRFGDPETQVILPRMKSDLLPVLEGTIEGRLNEHKISWDEEACVGVVLASGGYPDSYGTGFPVTGIESAERSALVFHSGTVRDGDGRVVTDGGRVLTVVSKGRTVEHARNEVYAHLPEIQFTGCHFRSDIASAETL